MAEGSHSAITLEAGKYRATVDPLGAALRTLHWGERELVWGYPEGRPQLAQGQILLPWPNRIDHGRYSFGGTTYQLEITEPELDNAIDLRDISDVHPRGPVNLHGGNRVQQR